MAYLGRKSAAAALISNDIPSDLVLKGSVVTVPTTDTATSRDSAIISPQNGMLTYNTEAGAIQQYNGAWATIALSPTITSISGFINEDDDSTITVFGSNFSATTLVKMFDASAGGNQIGSNATTTLVSVGVIKATFGGAGVPVAGNSVYIEVSNAGGNSRFETAIIVNADPVIAISGNSGTGADTTDHLGTYGGTNAGGGTDPNTALLLNFDRGGGTDVEDSSNLAADSSNKVIAVGHAKIKASPFGDGKTAMFFDGSDDNLTIASHANFNTLGTVSAWTIEFWFKATTGSNNFIMTNASGTGNAGLNIQWENSPQKLKVLMRHDTDWALNVGDSGWALPPDTWYHCAVVRSSTSLKVYINGLLYDSGTGTPTNTNTSTLVIGYKQPWSALMLGYLDEIRICHSVVYTGDFTVPTARFSGSGQSAGATGSNISAVTGPNTKLLIHSERTDEGNTAFVDSADDPYSDATHTITRTGTIHSLLHGGIAPAMAWPSNGKTFGSSGSYFDGTGDFLRVGVINTSPANLQFTATENFTIDFWMNTSSNQGTSGNGRFYGTNDGVNWANSNSWWIAYYHTGSEGYIHLNQSDGAADASKRVVVGNLHDSVWHHVAFVRAASANTSMLIYVDGNYKGTITVATVFGADNLAVSIACGDPNTSGSGFYTGYLDEYRISRSVRYSGTATTNWSNFSQPTMIYGGESSTTIPTITLTGTTTPALANDEDIEYTSDVTVENTTKPDGDRHLADTNIALTLTNLDGSDKSKATITGTIGGTVGTTFSNIPVKAQVRKTLGNAAYADASRVVTFSSSTTTIGLAPAMPVSGTGIPAGATITSVDTSTTITLSANPTGGTLTSQSLVFLDPTRISTINGPDTPSYPNDGSQTMMTIASQASNPAVLFNARRYTGTGANRSIEGFEFQPDFIYIRDRAAVHGLIYDSVRGVGNFFRPDTGGGNDTSLSTGVTKIGKDGFTVGTAGNHNGDNAKFIAWCWKAGGTPNGALGTIDANNPIGAGTISDTGGSTNITQSVNRTSGFSITKFTGLAGGSTIPHNLGATPAVIIMKGYGASGFGMWHQNLQATSQYYIAMDESGGQVSNSNAYSTAPSSTTITTGSDNVSGGAATDVMCYAWKAVAGVSAFGSYAGNDNITGAFVNTGFYPRFLMVKCITDGSNWMIWDSVRSGATTTGSSMLPRVRSNTAEAEVTNANDVEWYLSGSDKGWRPLTAEGGLNGASTRTYIYLAFA